MKSLSRPGRHAWLPIVLGALAQSTAAQTDAVPGPVRAPEAAATTEVEAPRVMQGETLPIEAIGPSWREDMAAVVERHKALGPDFAVYPRSRNGAQGTWAIPSSGASGLAHSGTKYATNKWGDTRMGIAFPETVDVSGFWIAGHQSRGSWARGVRAHGYQDGELVASTEWLESLEANYQWLALGMDGVDRIEIEARAAFEGSGWYAIDDLTFERDGTEVVIDFEDQPFRAKLTGSAYRGLTWETGTGDFASDSQGVHAPIIPDTDEVAPPSDVEVDNTIGVSGAITAPQLLSDFRGIIRGDAGQFSYPPDTCGAIGPNHFVVSVNLTVGIYDRNTGSNQLTVGLSSFFNTGSFIGDPRVHYDQFEDRWIMIASGFSGDPRIFFAYSDTSDPNGSWFKSVFQVAQGSDAGCWPDYPTLGYDQNGIYTGIFMVGCGMSLFAIDKAPLVANSGFGTITAFRGFSFEGALQPCATYGDSGGVYVISAPGSGMSLRQVQGPLTSPTLATKGVGNVPVYVTAPDAPAMGSSTDLDTVDTRLMNAVYRDGSIWTAHTVFNPGTQTSGARWYEIDPTTTPAATLLQNGTVTDSSLWYYFPTLCVNQNGDVVMGFTGSDANTFASAYYTGRKASDPAGMMAAPVLYKAGLAPQNNLDGFGRNRWGDYSLCTLDPLDETRIWTIQEYAQANDIWGTWIAELDPGPPPPVTYCTGKINSFFCLPFMSFVGSPSVSSTTVFRVQGNDVVPNEFGTLLYGTNGRSTLGFHNGTLCVKSPLTRVLPPKSSGSAGGGLCSGELRRNFNTTIQSGNDPVLTAGQTVNTQWLYRDPGVDSFNDGLTDGLEFQIQP